MEERALTNQLATLTHDLVTLRSEKQQLNEKKSKSRSSDKHGNYNKYGNRKGVESDENSVSVEYDDAAQVEEDARERDCDEALDALLSLQRQFQNLQARREESWKLLHTLSDREGAEGTLGSPINKSLHRSPNKSMNRSMHKSPHRPLDRTLDGVDIGADEEVSNGVDGCDEEEGALDDDFGDGFEDDYNIDDDDAAEQSVREAEEAEKAVGEELRSYAARIADLQLKVRLDGRKSLRTPSTHVS